MAMYLAPFRNIDVDGLKCFSTVLVLRQSYHSTSLLILVLLCSFSLEIWFWKEITSIKLSKHVCSINLENRSYFIYNDFKLHQSLTNIASFLNENKRTRNGSFSSRKQCCLVRPGNHIEEFKYAQISMFRSVHW